MNPLPVQEDLEDYCRDQVCAAKRKYDLASSRLEAMLRTLDASELREALQFQNAAQFEWAHASKVFRHVVLYGEIP
jgi:hypothetical protein